jgi:hypothetical protein
MPIIVGQMPRKIKVPAPGVPKDPEIARTSEVSAH